jgi:predicted RNase H-like HicB family nuclease
MDYNVIVFKEDGDFIATCKEMPSISGIGDTKLKAIEEFHIAISLAKEIMDEQGTPMPERIDGV